MSKQRGFRFPRVGIPLLALIWLGVTTIPFIFMVVSSLKSQQETFATNVWAPPSQLYWGNYAAVLEGPFFTYFRNSLFVVAVSVLLIVNAAAVVLLQIRLTRGTDSLTVAARAGRRAGLLLCLACVVLSFSSVSSTGLTITLLVLAALAHVGGEILESASGWGASYALAPPGLVGQYQGAHAMGRGIGDLIGPTLLTTVAIRRHGVPAVLRTLARAERAPASIAAI